VEPSLNIVDLVPLIDDRDPQAMFDEWSAAVQASDPTWVPVNGSLEAVIAEALCLSVSDLIYSVNRLPGVVLEALLALKDVPRHPGTPASGQVRIWLDTTRTISVPAGSRFMIDALEFVASDTVTVTADQLVVTVVAVDPGSLGNSVLPGVGVDWLDLDPHTVQVVAEGAFTARYLKVRCLQSWQRVFGLDNESDRWQAFSFTGKRLDAKIEVREFEVFGSPLLEAEAILGTTSPYDTADDKALASGTPAPISISVEMSAISV